MMNQNACGNPYVHTIQGNKRVLIEQWASLTVSKIQTNAQRRRTKEQMQDAIYGFHNYKINGIFHTCTHFLFCFEQPPWLKIQTNKQKLLPEQHFNVQLTTKPILRVKQNKNRHHGLVSSDMREEREREKRGMCGASTRKLICCFTPITIWH